ncbi:hypothetical protein HAX54_001984, partial [Datura stramonium]|nr:hypothetical protein [Datura stramonium]
WTGDLGSKSSWMGGVFCCREVIARRATTAERSGPMSEAIVTRLLKDSYPIAMGSFLLLGVYFLPRSQIWAPTLQTVLLPSNLFAATPLTAVEVHSM